MECLALDSAGGDRGCFNTNAFGGLCQSDYNEPEAAFTCGTTPMYACVPTDCTAASEKPATAQPDLGSGRCGY
jgi:hypothetical protein